MSSSTSAILREIIDVIDDIIGTTSPRIFRRREFLKCVFSPSQLDLWKQAETMEEKALKAEEKAVAESEKNFFNILSKQFGKESEAFFDDPATQESIRQLSDPENWFYNKDGSPHRPKPAVWKKYKDGAESYLGANVAKKLKTRLTISLKEVYQVVKKLNADGVLNIPFNWTATDKSSTDKLAKDVMFWVSDANGRHFEPAVADTTRKVMSQGLGFRETEDEMKKALDKTYKDKSDSYWFLMGNVGVQRARSFSKLSAFEDAGVTEYEIWAVLDNRTTPQCRYMNGRTFSLSHGQKIRDNTEAAKNPDMVRIQYPWVRYSSSRAKAGLDALYVNQPGGRSYLPASRMQPNNLTRPMGGNVSASGKQTLNTLVPLPPYHGHCRTTYVITEKAIQQLTQTQAEEKQPVGTPPFDVSKVQQQPGTTGSHGAYWTTDPATGKKYLFKPPTFGKGDADAHMNLAVAQLMKEVGLETPDFFVSEHNGKPVSIQSEITNLAGDLNGVDVKALSGKQVLEVQKNFVVDWLTGNFDNNRDNHVAKKDGKIVGVDKGQSFKFYGQEKLDGKWKPNQNYGRPFIYDILDEYAKGTEIPVANPKKDKAFGDFILAVQKIPPERIREIFMPYAVRAEAQGVKVFNKDNTVKEEFNTEKFFKKFEKRQKNLKKDFDKFYAIQSLKNGRQRMLEEERKKKAEEEARKKREEEERLRREEEEAARRAAAAKKKRKKRKKKRKPELNLPIGDRVDDDIPFLDSDLLKEAVKAGADGKAFLIGGGDFHNAQMIAYKVGGKGEGRGLHLEGRLSRSAAAKLMKFMRNHAEVPPDTVDRDEYFDEFILPIIKSVKSHTDPNHHNYDGKVPVKNAKKWRDTFGDVYKKINNLEGLLRDKMISQEEFDRTSKKWKYYREQLWKIGKQDDDFPDDDTEFNWNVNAVLKTTFKPYEEPKVVQPKREVPEGFDDVEKVRRFEWSRKRTKTNKLNTSTTTKDEKFKWSDGEMYTFKMGDVEFEFTPEDPYNPIAVQRRLIIRVKNEAKQNAKDLQQVVKDFSDRVGINFRPSSREDLEVAYLRKYAVQAGVEDDWKTKAPKTLPVETQVQRLREEAARLINVSVDELLKRDYYDFDVNYRRGAGWAVFGKRFDMTEKEFNRKFKGVTLQHNLFSGTKGTAKRLLDGIVAMESTEEKVRKGLVAPSRLNGGGMSPLADRKSGGADYHFCRISRDRNYGQIVYNRRLLLEIDSNSYPSDNYGAQKGDYRWEGRNKSLRDMWVSTDKGSNETNPFKSVPFEEFIEVIQVGNESEAQLLIENLKKAGIEELGGRPVEERVVSDEKGLDWKKVMSRTPEGDFLP
jgi:hypothetical protein